MLNLPKKLTWKRKEIYGEQMKGGLEVTLVQVPGHCSGIHKNDKH